jgi:two-component system, LytTR family, response regulator LytT
VNFIKTRSGQRYIVDYTLDELEQTLDTRQFYRANRQFIVHVKAVESVHPYFNSKLKIHLKPNTEEEVLISREKATEFKQWLGE